MKKLDGVFLVSLFAATAMVASSPQAHALEPPIVTYDVNYSFSDSSYPARSASLIGTLEIPIGNYTLQNQPPSPFTFVDLTLTVNGSSYAVNNVLTDLINGTGQFSIIASSTALIFDASRTGSDPADLIFSDSLNHQWNNRYVIGSDASPMFEAAFTNAGKVIDYDLSFPVTFAVIPEPTTFTLLGLGSLALVMVRRRK